MRDPRVGKAASRFENMVNADPMKIDKFAKGKPTDPTKKN